VRVEKWSPDNSFPYLYEAIAVQLRNHSHSTLPVGNPFLPYAWYALVGLILAVLAAIPYHRRTD